MQQVLTDSENLSLLTDIVRKNGAKNVLLVTGKSSYIKSSAKEKLEALLNNVTLIQFNDFTENPKVEDVLKGIDLFNLNKCELIVAVGGGSVIDMAKLIKAYHSNKENIGTLIEQNEIGKGTELIDLIVIPTTAGSGSEATHFAVVYKNKLKYSVADISLLPSTVFLCAEFTLSASPHLTAVTGIDAFSQAMESWWSIYSTETSIAYSSKALRLIWENLPLAVIENSVSAKRKLMEASHLAGKAINITKTTGPHALSYGFTTHCNVPHGNAVAMFLPSFINLNYNISERTCNDTRGANWVLSIMENIAEKLNTSSLNLADEVVSFFTRCGLNINFKSLGISEQDYNNALSGVNQDRLKNNPTLIDPPTISSFYFSKFNNE